MEQRWYPINRPACPKCGGKLELLEVAFSADGEIRTTAGCPKCGIAIILKSYASRLAWQALEQDMLADRVEEMTKNLPPIQGPDIPLVPPLAQKPEEMTDEDRKFLKDLGIGDSDET